VNDTPYPMEAHLVHVDAAGKPAAVVGVFTKAGKENAGLAKAFFSYAGSLTTPPCTEGVTWYVFNSPIEMSPAQIRAFTTLEHLGHTNRPIQSRGGRVVLVDSTPGK